MNSSALHVDTPITSIWLVYSAHNTHHCLYNFYYSLTLIYNSQPHHRHCYQHYYLKPPNSCHKQTLIITKIIIISPRLIINIITHTINKWSQAERDIKGKNKERKKWRNMNPSQTRRDVPSSKANGSPSNRSIYININHTLINFNIIIINTHNISMIEREKRRTKTSTEDNATPKKEFKPALMRAVRFAFVLRSLYFPRYLYLRFS